MKYLSLATKRGDMKSGKKYKNSVKEAFEGSVMVRRFGSNIKIPSVTNILI